MDIKKKLLEIYIKEKNKLEESIKKNHRNLNSSIASLKSIESRKDVDFEQEAEKQIKRIESNKSVKNLEVTENNMIIIYTNSIICTDEKGNKYELGEYKIDIPINSMNGIKFERLTKFDNEAELYTAPHIQGSACWGNTSEMLTSAYGQGDIDSVIYLCIEFLKHADSADQWGKNVVKWPRIKG